MPLIELSMESVAFPPPRFADKEGLLAIGGDLSVKRLLNAYANGIFPWYNPGEVIQWWCPRTRFVIFPDKVHVSRSMKKVLRKSRLETKINIDFDSIIRNCRMQREGETWIDDEMESAYKKLFRGGWAVCVGVYDSDDLVGGLYGVSIGKCFFGESMFSKVANASKIALIHLCVLLSKNDFVFVDCQFHTQHLEKMGGRFISWDAYRRLLAKGLAMLCVFDDEKLSPFPSNG